MTSIENISPSFLLAYVSSQKNKKMTPEDIFKALSFELGGDGKTITKKQIEDYLKKAESGEISAGKTRINALKSILNNWGNISNGKDYITYGDMSGSIILLLKAYTDSWEPNSEDTLSNNSTKFDLKKYLKDTLGITNFNDNDLSSLNSHLKKLLETDSNDDSISEAIDSLVNLMAQKSSTTSVEVEA